jgi:3-oxoacyl-[acyl-carrier-protein] synthase II
VRTVLSNSYGFGGNNTSVIVRAADSTVDAPRLRTTECADGADRIVVTGIGVVSPIGIGCEQFWNALCRGESGVTVLTDEALTHGVPTLGAPVREFAPREFIASTHLRRMDALSRMIVAASRMALDDARFLGARVPTDRVGVVVGSAIGDVAGSLAHLDKVFTKGPAAASPMNFPNLVLNAPASYVAMEFGFTGVNLTVAHAEVSGEHALVAAIDALRAGRADVMLAGGGDELGTIVLEVLRRLRVLAGQRGGRMWVSPYDRGRSGIALGEGAAMLVLERAPHARARGARAYAEVAGTTCFSVPAPLYHWPASAAAAAPALRRLVGDAPVDVVCGSANSSARLDAAELELLGAVTGPDQSRPVVTSIKGAIGEFGAAGALTSAAACLALHTQTVPPLCRLDDPEPGAVRFAAPRGEPHAMRRALVCGLARGGAGVALQFDRARI